MDIEDLPELLRLLNLQSSQVASVPAQSQSQTPQSEAPPGTFEPVFRPSGPSPLLARSTSTKVRSPQTVPYGYSWQGSASTTASVSRCFSTRKAPRSAPPPSAASSYHKGTSITDLDYLTSYTIEGTDYGSDEELYAEAMAYEYKPKVPWGQPIAYLGELSYECIAFLKWEERQDWIDSLSSTFWDRDNFRNQMKLAGFDAGRVRLLERCIQEDIESRIENGTQGQLWRR